MRKEIGRAAAWHRLNSRYEPQCPSRIDDEPAGIPALPTWQQTAWGVFCSDRMPVYLSERPMVRRLPLAGHISKQSTFSNFPRYARILLDYFLIIFRPCNYAAHLNVVLLTLAIALLHGPAWGQDFPAGFEKLIDKQKTGEKQEKTSDGKAKMGLNDPECNNEQCKMLWSEIRDVLEIWHAYKASPSSSAADVKDIKKALGVDHAGYGNIQTRV